MVHKLLVYDHVCARAYVHAQTARNQEVSGTVLTMMMYNHKNIKTAVVKLTQLNITEHRTEVFETRQTSDG